MASPDEAFNPYSGRFNNPNLTPFICSFEPFIVITTIEKNPNLTLV